MTESGSSYGDEFTGWVIGNNYKQRGKPSGSYGAVHNGPWYIDAAGKMWSAFDVTFIPDPLPSAEQAPARLCARCGQTEFGWKYNRCPHCGEMAEEQAPAGQALIDALEEDGYLKNQALDELRSQLGQEKRSHATTILERDRTMAQLSTTLEITRELAAALEKIHGYRLEDDCEICTCNTDCSQCVARVALAKARAAGLLDAQGPAEDAAEGGKA